MWKWILVAFFAAFLLLIVYLANTAALPPVLFFIYMFPMGDKIAHMLLMGTMSFLVNYALTGRTTIIANRPVLTGSLWVLGIVTLEELTQAFNPNRSFSFGDWLFDLIGIAAGGWLAVQLCRYLAKQKTANMLTE
jgi:VanZ family protein